MKRPFTFSNLACAVLTATILCATPLQTNAQSGPAQHLSAEQTTQEDAPSVQRLVVTFKPGPNRRALAASSATSLTKQHRLSEVRTSDSGFTIFETPAMTRRQAQDLARVMREDPRVQAVELDFKVRPLQALTREPFSSLQWEHMAPGVSNGMLHWGGIHLDALHARTQGSQSLIAILDSGILPRHPEFRAGTFAAGWDFITDPALAADGDGRDADATDPGDFCKDPQNFSNSTWHGTRLASIAAAARNGRGMLGVAPEARLLSARVMGRCGGWMTDVTDAMRWAAGLPVNGVPAHHQGRAVINVSLGSIKGNERCPVFVQETIDEVNKTGSIIVAAAGNEGITGRQAVPADCNGVISVTAHTAAADLALYANFSTKTTVSAPGGGTCRTLRGDACGPAGVVSAGVGGVETLVNYTSNQYVVGTSPAAAIVSGVVALLLELDPTLDVSRIESLLRNNSRPFRPGTHCTSIQPCSFGMLDAGLVLAAVDARFQPTVTVDAPTSPARVGSSISLTAKGSSPAGNASLVYTWTQLSGPPVQLSSSGATVSFTVPNAKEIVTLQVSVRDGGGRTATAPVQVSIQQFREPVVTAAGSLSPVTAGAPWSLVPTVSDDDGDYSHLVVLSGPNGLKASGRTLEWNTPTVGVHEVVFVAVDATGLQSARSTVSLQVVSSGSSPQGSGATGSGGGSGGGNQGLLGLLLMSMAIAYARHLRLRGAK